MKLIRYAIRKEDLHQLLHTIGVLRPEEQLLAVNNLDLAEQQQEVVVITVNAEPKHVLPDDVSAWTDKEIQQRYAELSVLEDAASRQLAKAQAEMESLRSERDKRASDIELSDDGIPGTVEMNIWDQVRRLLGGGQEPKT
jgi:GTPase involved in cell partitioning and DNA repair